MKREETEEPREVGRPTSPPGGVEMATESWSWVTVGWTREAEPGGRAGRLAEDQGVACEGPGTWTVLQGLGQ